MVVVTFRLEEETHKRLKNLAEKQGLTLSDKLRSLVKEEVGENAIMEETDEMDIPTLCERADLTDKRKRLLLRVMDEKRKGLITINEVWGISRQYNIYSQKHYIKQAVQELGENPFIPFTSSESGGLKPLKVRCPSCSFEMFPAQISANDGECLDCGFLLYDFSFIHEAPDQVVIQEEEDIEDEDEEVEAVFNAEPVEKEEHRD